MAAISDKIQQLHERKFCIRVLRPEIIVIKKVNKKEE